MDNRIEIVDLRTGDITLRPNARTICYFIVENITERETIKKIAMELLLSGCREFHFYGKQEPLWHLLFDEVDIMINPDSTTEDVALTAGYEVLDEFLEELIKGTSMRAFVPQQYVLFYDNDKLYEQTKSMGAEKWQR